MVLYFAKIDKRGQITLPLSFKNVYDFSHGDYICYVGNKENIVVFKDNVKTLFSGFTDYPVFTKSKVTDKYQTTIPVVVRNELKINEIGYIAFLDINYSQGKVAFILNPTDTITKSMKVTTNSGVWGFDEKLKSGKRSLDFLININKELQVRT